MRKLLFWTPGLLLAFGVALSACPGGPGGGGGGNDAGFEIVDSGVAGGEGEGEGAAGEGEGEGEGGFQLCDGGLCPDGGIQGEVYTGVAEDGTKCDGALCPIGEDCCLSFDAQFNVHGACSGPQACPNQTAATERCDGAEDCAPGEECCFNGSFGGAGGLSSTCVTTGTCEGDGSHGTVCITGVDCLSTELCCGLPSNGVAIPVDMGVCAPAANNCQVN